MYQNSTQKNAIHFKNGVVRINLDILKCSKVELVKNKHLQVVQFQSDYEQNTVMLTLEQLNSLRETFLVHVEIDTDKKQSTLAGYKSRTRLFIKWLQQNNIHNVSMNHWREYYASIKRSDLTKTSVRNYFRDLNAFVVWLIEKGHLPYNPLGDITPPSAGKKSVHEKAIPKKDINIMIEHAQTIRDRAIFVFFRDAACRGSEAAVMQWESVDFDQGKAYVIGKGDKLRTLRFKPSTAQILKEYRNTLKEEQKTGSVWWGKQGALTYSGIYQVFRRTARRASLKNKKFNPHAWRHAFGRDATEAGMPTAILQQVMGHEHISTTALYSESGEDAVQRAHHQYSPVDNEIDSNEGSL